MKGVISWLVVSISFIIVVVIIIIVYTRKIKKAKTLLVQKNQELFRQIETTKNIISDYAADQKKRVSTDEEKPYVAETGTPEKLILLKKIQKTMDNIDIISNPDFSLPELAQLTESNTSYVSAAINETYGKNFKTFLNEYRIHEACRRLTNPRYSKLTIAAICSEVGFKSQNSFIVNFKKVTGLTPSVYRSISNNESFEDKQDSDD